MCRWRVYVYKRPSLSSKIGTLVVNLGIHVIAKRTYPHSDHQQQLDSQCSRSCAWFDAVGVGPFFCRYGFCFIRIVSNFCTGALQINDMLYSAAGAILFSFYLAYHTRLIVGGKHTWMRKTTFLLQWRVSSLQVYLSSIHGYKQIPQLLTWYQISEYKSIRLFEKDIFPFFLKHLLIPISYNRADFTSFQYPYLQYIITSKTIVIVKPNQTKPGRL